MGCSPCSGAGAFIPLVTPLEVICPAKAAETCTFAFHVDAAAQSELGSEAAFRYLGDAQTAVPQGTIPQMPPHTSYYMWTRDGINGQVVSESYTFVELVKNNKDS